MDMVILLVVAAAIVWVLTKRTSVIPSATGMTIFWILLIGAAIALVLDLGRGGPPSTVPPG